MPNSSSAHSGKRTTAAPTNDAASAAQISGQRQPDTLPPKTRASSRDLTTAANAKARASAIAGPVACHIIGQPSFRMPTINKAASAASSAIIVRLMTMLRCRAV
jgi:hypothetical protein